MFFMLRALAFLFGLLFLVFGISGFFPSLMTEDKLFDIFHLNTEQTIFYLITGLIAIWVSFASEFAPRYYFQVFGIISGIVAILGFIYEDSDICTSGPPCACTLLRAGD